MVEGDIAGGALGSVGKWDLAFKGGKLVLMGDASMAFAQVDLSISVGAKQVLDAIAAAVPGTLDDQIIKLLEAGLGIV